MEPKVTDIELTKPSSTATDASDIQLMPDTTPDQRIRIASQSIGIDRLDTDRTNSNNSNNSNELHHMNESNVDIDLLNTKNNKARSKTKFELIKSILNIALEGDLAGFQIAWLCMSTCFFVLKIFGSTGVVQRIQWWAIFVIPTMNALLTAWFDYIITKYRSTKKTVESLKKKRFVVLWAIKVIGSIYIASYWIWGPDSFLERFSKTADYQSYFEYINSQNRSIFCSFC